MSDLEFLKEMREKLDKYAEKRDPTLLEYVRLMIQDWIDELEGEKRD